MTSVLRILSGAYGLRIWYVLAKLRLYFRGRFAVSGNHNGRADGDLSVYQRPLNCIFYDALCWRCMLYGIYISIKPANHAIGEGLAEATGVINYVF